MIAVEPSGRESIRRAIALRSRTTAAAALVLASAVGWLYSDVVPPMVRQWATDEDYSHGFFVVPLALFFAWERRNALRMAERRPSLAGLAVLAASLVCFVAGRFGAELFLTRISLIGVIAGLVLFTLGVRHARLLAFPIAFLVLMVPLPSIVFNRIAFPLQMLASQTGEAIIAASGIPVFREGTVLQLPGRALEVVEACAGIRSLISLSMLAIVLGYFTERRTGPRVAIAAAAIPIAVVANAIRVAGTGIMSYWVSPAAAEGFFHTFSGWLVFIGALAGLRGFHRAMEFARGRWWAPARLEPQC
jgi:exosortase